MDATDLRLLDLVQRDGTLTNERLGEMVGASPSAVNRRLRKLRSSGVIREMTAVVDQKAVGRPLTFVVGLEVERKQPDLYDRLRRWLVAVDAVQQAYNVTGPNDFVVVITAESVEQYDRIMDEMLAANHNIKKYNTNLVLTSFKQCLFVPTIPE